MTKRIVWLFSVALLAACGGPPAASLELLAGTWAVDFDASWRRSREAFLADTIRGSAAYPDDPDEKAAVVRGEMEKLLGKTTFTFGAGGTVVTDLGGRKREGTLEVQERDGPTLRFLGEIGRRGEYEVTFETEDRLVLRMPGDDSRVELVLERES